jgi:hypothetical protein
LQINRGIIAENGAGGCGLELTSHKGDSPFCEIRIEANVKNIHNQRRFLQVFDNQGFRLPK